MAVTGHQTLEEVERYAKAARRKKLADSAMRKLYRGAVAGSWIARHYRGGGIYATEAIGAADDTLEADGATVLDYWQAQEHAKRWADRQRQIAEGRLREGLYTVADAVKDYLGEIAAEKLGHADTRMTEKHYAHLSPSYVAQTIRANFPVLNLAEESQVVPLRRRIAT